jgi:hypothetical protein
MDALSHRPFIGRHLGDARSEVLFALSAQLVGAEPRGRLPFAGALLHRRALLVRPDAG